MNREEKKQATRTKLLDAAIDLFAQQGYEATTVSQITDKAGVSKGTFFNYFSTKENVLAQLKVTLTMEQLRRLLDQQGSITPCLEALVQLQTEHLRGSRPLTLAMLQGVIGTASALDIQNEQIRDLKETLIPIFRAGQASEEFRSDLRAEEMADWAVQTFFGALLWWGMGNGDESMEQHMSVSFGPFYRYIRP